jgi:hypothetical protein
MFSSIGYLAKTIKLTQAAAAVSAANQRPAIHFNSCCAVFSSFFLLFFAFSCFFLISSLIILIKKTIESS